MTTGEIKEGSWRNDPPTQGGYEAGRCMRIALKHFGSKGDQFHFAEVACGCQFL